MKKQVKSHEIHRPSPGDPWCRITRVYDDGSKEEIGHIHIESLVEDGLPDFMTQEDW